MTHSTVADAEALLRVSALKRDKVRRLLEYVGTTTGRRCLDLGGDNGVVSLMLRSAGGSWVSADGAEDAARAIRQVVGPQVCQIAGAALPFATASLDVVVVADYLEHVHDDRLLVRELARIVRPGGAVVINVPHVNPGSWLTPVRHAAGLTDEWHGHVRPGYRWAALADLLSPFFEADRHETYGRAFSEALDIALNAVRLRVEGRKPSSAKGPIIAVEEFKAGKRTGAAVHLLGPVFRAIVWLDHLLFFQDGYRLVLHARRTQVTVDQ